MVSWSLQSRRGVLRTALASAASVISPAAWSADPAAAFRGIPKSMWVWKTALEELPEMEAFATAWRIERVLLSLSPRVLDQIKAREDGLDPVRKLRDAGLGVFALSGDPEWLRQQELPRTLARIIDMAPGTFDGLALDVEPQALAAWHTGSRPELLQALIQFLDRVRARAGHLPVGAALNPVYANIPLGAGGGNALEALCKRLDFVSLMAYRNQPEAAVGWAKPAAEILDKAGVSWSLGVLVHASNEKRTSYFGSDRSAFLSDMVRLHGLMSGRFQAAYKGLIFEDYRGLRKILEGA